MNKDNVLSIAGREANTDALSELLASGAQQLIRQAVEAELESFLQQYQDRRLDDGRAAVVRNGYQPERELQTGIGPVSVQIPKVRSRDGEPVTFRSALVPPYVRKTKSLEAALPWLYLKGVSTGEMSQALEVLVGAQAKGFSAATVARLKKQWADDYRQWNTKRLDDRRWVYICGLMASIAASGLRTQSCVP